SKIMQDAMIQISNGRRKGKEGAALRWGWLTIAAVGEGPMGEGRRLEFVVAGRLGGQPHGRTGCEGGLRQTTTGPWQFGEGESNLEETQSFIKRVQRFENVSAEALCWLLNARSHNFLLPINSMQQTEQMPYVTPIIYK
ncbi:hypothetical protein KI387_005440, partial [Taxus chinensis]